MEEKTRRFLESAAIQNGTTLDGVLQQVLHLGQDDLAALYFDDALPRVRDLVRALDEGVRVRNPGLHYVVRSTFIGFRREENPPRTRGGRTQTFLSVVRRKTDLSVVLPAKPADGHSLGIEHLQEKGHHGVGDVRVLLQDQTQLSLFFEAFADWLAPEPRPMLDLE
ncbi:hypothetical protein [Curtobacterium sp. APC 4022]|uniref:hypothetical protein n=1 Tax=Curtobacterium sp. APC 4022 TaxID=3035201 RepID=UPI0025B37FCC|nr:hypothetical protein [Curtobacterium sp. APC 4022]MDN3478297.1 hypothetical protein [Curtobacterium sp. APC 4022]